VKGLGDSSRNAIPNKTWRVHSIHGGPACGESTLEFSLEPPGFAGQWYVVAGVNFTGSEGFGQRFIETINGDYAHASRGSRGRDDCLLRRGYIDRKRLVATRGRAQLRR